MDAVWAAVAGAHCADPPVLFSSLCEFYVKAKEVAFVCQGSMAELSVRWALRKGVMLAGAEVTLYDFLGDGEAFLISLTGINAVGDRCSRCR